MLRASFLLLATLPGVLAAQHPYGHFTEAIEGRHARAHPIVAYRLRIDSADLSRFRVELRIRNAPDTLRLAMAIHPEYDDRFWRNVTAITAEAGGRPMPVVREDSTVWRVTGAARDVVVRYEIQVPTPGSPRGAWRPFISTSGALSGGPHAFMYVLGGTLGPAHVTLEIPASWRIATGLPPTSDPLTFFAPTISALIDSPIFVGRFSDWRFAVDGVPHRIVYWPRESGAAAFDTVAFVRGIERLTRQAVALFGRAPYREYTFLFQDDAYGGLEHYNSVTLGVDGKRLAADPDSHLPETAHEFVHAWNLMRIRPAEYRGVSHRPPTMSGALWFSEGLTLFYADLLLRRAGLESDSGRTRHLEGLIQRYLTFTGNSRLSAEAVSRAAYAETEGIGDYVASPHLQGELIGTMLDLVIRNATAGRRSMDDVMRRMLDRFSAERGFASRDVERVVAEVCGCSVTSFFAAHVRAGGALDFSRYLALAGLGYRVSWEPARNADGSLALDRWAYVEEAPGGGMRLVLQRPESAWGRAGLHSGDRVRSINGRPIASWPDFRAVLTAAAIGDTLRVEVVRDSGPYTGIVRMAGFDHPVVRIEPLASASARQVALRDAWLRGAP